jgi:LacI family transcriptional regulator
MRTRTDIAAPQAPARRAVTMHDVAALAGVSAMTVSNVVNGRGRPVREETRERVLAAIAELNYRPSSSGRDLRLGKRFTIGVVVVDAISDLLSSPFTTGLLSGLCEVLNEEGYVVMLQGIRPQDFEQTFPFRQAGADAYCIKLTGSAEGRADMLRVLERIEEPLIVVHEAMPLTGADRMTIRQDDFGGARLMARHLRARGVLRPVLVTTRNSAPMGSRRIAGFRAGFADADIPVITAPSNNLVGGLAAIEDYLKAIGELPDALVCANDEFAYAALRVAQARGLNVPADIMVTGFNGFRPPAYFNPSLTCVVSRPADIGRAAARCLMRRMAGHPFETRDLVLPLSLRMGESTR